MLLQIVRDVINRRIVVSPIFSYERSARNRFPVCRLAYLTHPSFAINGPRKDRAFAVSFIVDSLPLTS
jgi:hypothetical protein